MIRKMIFHFGRYVLWLRNIFSRPEKPHMYYRETIRQMDDIGIGSMKIVLIISIFIGAVVAVQLSYQLGSTLIPKWYVGYILRDLVIIDMAPTITCLVLAGKVGSNIAAEIGGMRQKEHIDAMEVMGVNTTAFLVLPKLLAGLFTTPLLVILAAGLGIGSGYAVSTLGGYFTSGEFLQGLTTFYDPYNVTIMIIKSLVYGFIFTTVPAYHGYFVKSGSIELGKAGTDAVVYSNILILFADYIIATAMTG
jgi:phospholipid/cholesterol/gamma-HCH transport system permease protein